MDSKIYIFLADGFEEMEALIPYDVLKRAGFEVELVSVKTDLNVVSTHGLTVMCDTDISKISQGNATLLLLPGGMPGASNLAESKDLAKMLLQQNEEGKWVAAICAAPYVLGDLGILKGKQATCFPGYESHLSGAEHIASSVVVSQNVITGNGAGAAVKFAFAIVEQLRGKRVADFLAEKMLLA
ncbi:MAG: DJ-1/PfpI family protein [Bacteroidales bacterium]|nr:DJ-1/PfpI family protein [Bacteroidales bacterium]